MINLEKTKIKTFPLNFTPPFFKKKVKIFFFLKRWDGVPEL